MQRIHFTAADFARIRLRATLGPLVETAFALGLLHRGVGASHAQWRKQVGGRLPGGSLPAQDPDVLLLQALRITSDGPRPVASELPEIWKRVVAPYWPRMLSYLEAEREARGRIVMAGGAERLLATLHSRIPWHPPVLELPGGPDEDVFLDGSGLTLVPSVFLHHRPGQFIEAQEDQGQAMLLFAAPPGPQEADRLWAQLEGGVRSLGALVGQTRAAVLQALRATCTTTELADRLGISPAGASQHTAVLRRTGLITTRRLRNTVLHTVTPLGRALLDGDAVQDEHPLQARRTVQPTS